MDKTGNEVKGWNFKTKNSKISDKLQHFVVGSKDYILYPAKDKNLALLARNGKTRVNYNVTSEFSSQSLQVDKKGTLYGITFEGKLWRGTLEGNAIELTLPNLISNSKFLIDKNTLIYSNEKNIFIVDEKFDLLHTFELANRIEDISTFNDNLIIKTNTAIYVWKDGEIKEGTPIETNGLTTANDLDKDGKINLMISRDAFLYNFEIE